MAETKSQYDAAVKQFAKLRGSSRKTKHAPDAAELRKAEASCEFARHQCVAPSPSVNGSFYRCIMFDIYSESEYERTF